MNQPTNNRQPDDSPPTPAFRSVSMTSMGPPSGIRLFSHPQQQHHPKEHLKLSRMKQQTLIEPKNSDSDGWKWTLSHVSTVPMYHPLERTAIHIKETLDIITGRISTFMKIHSIQCIYHDDLGRVDCSTNDFLDFVVQLWQKSDDKQVVVEIQRRQGCSIAMHTMRQALIETIRHGTHDLIEERKEHSQRTCSFLQRLPVPPTAAKDASSYCCLEQCLEISKHLLNSDLLDQNRLGLESFHLLTDLSKVMLDDAFETSKQIVQDESLQALLFKFLTPAATIPQGVANFYNALHFLTLKILSNALEILTSQPKYVEINLNNLFWKTVIQSSHEHIQSVQERPNEASYSIKILRLLHLKSPLYQIPSTQGLQVAHEYGRQYNRSLERETERFMMAY